MIVSTQAEQQARSAFRDFVSRDILPDASRVDREQGVSEEVIRKLVARGYLAPWLPESYGGTAMDLVTYGLLTEEVGFACSSTRSLLTAHGMTVQAIFKCGSRDQKRELLPLLARGERLSAFAISEPNVGSDAGNPETIAVPVGGNYSITGEKTWVTFGQRADIFLLLAACEGKPTAFLVDRESPGLDVTPISGMLGTRGALLAKLSFKACHVPMERRLGQEGAGFTMVVSTALGHGHYSVAWGCVGLIRACLSESTKYTSTRHQFGLELRHHQLVKRIITNMRTDLRCADLLCRHSGQLKNQGDPRAFMETMMAKYFASTAAKRAADNAVQLHGGVGCSDLYPVERFYRDAKIMEIIEGSSQILQAMISDYAYQQDLGT